MSSMHITHNLAKTSSGIIIFVIGPTPQNPCGYFHLSKILRPNSREYILIWQRSYDSSPLLTSSFVNHITTRVPYWRSHSSDIPKHKSLTDFLIRQRPNSCTDILIRQTCYNPNPLRTSLFIRGPTTNGHSHSSNMLQHKFHNSSFVLLFFILPTTQVPYGHSHSSETLKPNSCTDILIRPRHYNPGPVRIFSFVRVPTTQLS